MPWYAALFVGCTIVLAAASLCWGDWPERVIAVTMLVGTILTRLVQPGQLTGFRHVETAILTIDLGVAALFLWVALRSDRWWPMLATALLAPSLLAHLARLVAPDLRATGYAMAALSTYLLPPLVAAGIWRAYRRRHAPLI